MKTKFINAEKSGCIIEPRYYNFGWTKNPRILARPSALRALIKARKHLPKGHNFKIWDCQRPRPVQIAMMRSFKRRLEIMHPRAPKEKILKLVKRFGGSLVPKLRIRPDTHRNGGAFDLTIVDREGNELWMGTNHDDLTDKAATDYFEKKKSLTPLDRAARKNRRLLSRAMTRAGFRNYAPEWWHWGYEK